MMKSQSGCFRVIAVLGLAASAFAQSVVDAELIFNSGLQHMRDGRLESALEAFRRAVKQDPKNPYFHKALGLAYSQLADRCAATDAKCRQNHLQNAVGEARKALELNPHYVDARNDLGTLLILSGKREEGKKELTKAYEDPTNPTREISARNLGQAYFEEKNFPQALNWFETSLQLNRAYTDAHLGIADTLVAQDRVGEAVLRLEAAVKDLPDDASLLLGLGQAYYRAQRFGDAKSRLEQAVAKDQAGPYGRRASELLRHFPR
jgi:Flp pilus assembly protein TadD